MNTQHAKQYIEWIVILSYTIIIVVCVRVRGNAVWPPKLRSTMKQYNHLYVSYLRGGRTSLTRYCYYYYYYLCACVKTYRAYALETFGTILTIITITLRHYDIKITRRVRTSGVDPSSSSSSIRAGVPRVSRRDRSDEVFVFPGPHAMITRQRIQYYYINLYSIVRHEYC